MNKTVFDHLQRKVEIAIPPKRIISLCPSITETLFALELDEQIVGRTRYCIHPRDKVIHVPTVGGTKEVDFEKIAQLKPDLILSEKEENTKEMVDILSNKYPVFVFEIETYLDALRMIRDIGELTDRLRIANDIIQRIERSFSQIKPINECKVAYVIWRKPYMVAGNHTFIHSMLERLGFTNVFAGYPGRYPTVTIEDFQKADPDVILLSSEPFPFQEKHIAEFMEFLPGKRAVLVDGEMFSWSGAHMEQAPAYFQQLISKLS